LLASARFEQQVSPTTYATDDLLQTASSYQARRASRTRTRAGLGARAARADHRVVQEVTTVRAEEMRPAMGRLPHTLRRAWQRRAGVPPAAETR
jgi:hypothetical protein